MGLIFPKVNKSVALLAIMIGEGEERGCPKNMWSDARLEIEPPPTNSCLASSCVDDTESSIDCAIANVADE